MRNTNIEDILFHVSTIPLYYDRVINDREEKHYVGNYKAIINLDTGNVISVVSKDYKLVANEKAIEYGKEAFKQLFNALDTSQMEIYNINTPEQLESANNYYSKIK